MSKKKPAEPVIIENIFSQSLDDLMGDRFAIYAKDVIQDRAIPDARDGLKPVQRRILFGMYEAGYFINKPTKKCAHIVGDVMGKYHPHGDSSIYEALVHMSQNWAYRMPLIDFQGNNGSIDGDGPAAYRYTEARLSALSNEMLMDLDKDTVEMEFTFDDTLTEPTVLPARFPNMLVNGSEGIAVGISTSIPPHNLKEVCQTIIYRIKHPSCTVDQLLEYLPGPDFPTGGIIYNSEAMKDIYRTGRGRVVTASRCEIVEEKDGSQQILVREIPFRVNKSVLVKEIDKIRHDKTIPGIVEVRDESDKEGIRIAIDLKNDAKPQAILGYLMTKTSLKSAYTAHIVAIVDGRPTTLDLASYCDCYIAHQLDVITRRSAYLLKKNEARLSIVEGLIKAVSILDEIIKIIRASENKADAKKNLQQAYGFEEDQVEAIVMMPLYKLSNTDMAVLEKERVTLKEEIENLNLLLSSQEEREKLIISDLNRIAKEYGDPRRSEITDEEEHGNNLNKRDLIAKEECYVVATRDGYLKRSSVKSWKGSGGQNGARPGIKSGDAIVYNGLCTTTDFMLIFTDKGNYLYIPVNEIKETKWNDEGFHVNSLVQIKPEERILRAFAVRKFRNDLNMVVLSKHGLIKRMVLSSFPVVRRSKPVPAIKLFNDDKLVDVVWTSGNSNLLVASADGRAVYYNENDIQLTNPKTGGLKAGNFSGKEMAGLVAFSPNEKGTKVLFVTDRDHTRVFDLSHIELTKRLGKPMTLYNMFKSEPHRLIYMTKVGEKALPYAIDAVLDDDSRIDVVFQDFYLTDMGKYAKRPNDFPAKKHIRFVSREDRDLIDDSIKAFAPPVVEKPVEPVAPLQADVGPVVEQNVQPASNFEQMNLFDEDLDDDGGLLDS